MAWATITIGLTTTLASGNTSPVTLTYTLSTTDAQDAYTFVQSVLKNGGLFTDSKHFIPVTAIQYMDIS